MLCAIVLVTIFPVSPLVSAQTVTISFRSQEDLVFVNAFVNGHQASLILDTGAVSTFISPEAAGMSNTAGIGTLRSNSQLAKSVSRNVTLAFDEDGSAFSQTVTVANLNELSKRIGRKCDGILGQDFLRNFRAFTINYKTSTIAFTR